MTVISQAFQLTKKGHCIVLNVARHSLCKLQGLPLNIDDPSAMTTGKCCLSDTAAGKRMTLLRNYYSWENSINSKQKAT